MASVKWTKQYPRTPLPEGLKLPEGPGRQLTPDQVATYLAGVPMAHALDGAGLTPEQVEDLRLGMPLAVVTDPNPYGTPMEILGDNNTVSNVIDDPNVPQVPVSPKLGVSGWALLLLAAYGTVSAAFDLLRLF